MLCQNNDFSVFYTFILYVFITYLVLYVYEAKFIIYLYFTPEKRCRNLRIISHQKQRFLIRETWCRALVSSSKGKTHFDLYKRQCRRENPEAPGQRKQMRPPVSEAHRKLLGSES